MTKQFQRRPMFIIALLATTLAGLLTSCLSWLQPERTYENEISSSKGYDTIDPDTVLESLANGDLDVFTPSIATPELTFSLEGKTITWNQSDYLQIATALHQFVWQEQLEDWKLHSMSFRMACEDVDRGFLFGEFEYYKIVDINNQESRLVHNIHIRPGSNSVDWLERELYPIREKWQEIDLTQIKVTVTDALLMAEGNGGDTIRQAVSNECDIYLLLKLDAFYEGWQVGYSSGGPQNIFEIHIDPFSGEYEVVNP